MIRFSLLGLGALGGVAAVVWPTAAAANPMPLPFTYVYSTLPKGEAEVEQYADLTPIKAPTVAGGNDAVYLASQFQTEFEYGITDRLELGLYFAFQPALAGIQAGYQPPLTEGTGAKQRLRYRIAEEGELPVDVALYGEIVEFDTELELEAKIILQKRFGDLILAANLWGEVEREYASDGVDWVANPTLGATYQLSPVVHLGIEGWMRGEWPSDASGQRPFALGPHEFVGPTCMFDFGRIWWSTGVYVRVDDVTRSMQPLDNYGPVWVRTIIGFGL
jgi:hypothetical protein